MKVMDFRSHRVVQLFVYGLKIEIVCEETYRESTVFSNPHIKIVENGKNITPKILGMTKMFRLHHDESLQYIIDLVRLYRENPLLDLNLSKNISEGITDSKRDYDPPIIVIKTDKKIHDSNPDFWNWDNRLVGVGHEDTTGFLTLAGHEIVNDQIEITKYQFDQSTDHQWVKNEMYEIERTHPNLIKNWRIVLNPLRTLYKTYLDYV